MPGGVVQAEGKRSPLRVLITGVTGQDGSYLAEQMTAAGHEVHGLVRGQANSRLPWLRSLVPSLNIIGGDLLDTGSLHRALALAQPDVVFHLAAVTFVGVSWDQPSLFAEVTGLGTLRMLEAIRAVNPAIRLVQASTSEMFGASPPPQNEGTPFLPRSPYAAAKVLAHQMVSCYRDAWGLHASAAIMFNHESPRRGEEFVTRKVSAAVARIAAGKQHVLTLGRLDTSRDWGWAPDFMRALPVIAAQDEPGDYVIAAGQSATVAQMCETAFAAAGLDWQEHVISDPALHRPADVEALQGDASKAARVLGWKPEMTFREVVARMVEHDMARETAA